MTRPCHDPTVNKDRRQSPKSCVWTDPNDATNLDHTLSVVSYRDGVMVFYSPCVDSGSQVIRSLATSSGLGLSE